MEQAASCFNPAFKGRQRMLVAFGLLGATILPFGFGVAVVTYLLPDPTGTVAGLVTAWCYVTAMWLLWGAHQRLPLIGNARLHAQIRARYREESSAGGAFVGFAPGSELRSWDGETDRDVGLLQLQPAGMVYHGDNFSWSLRREAVDRIELTPPIGTPIRVVIRWHVAGDSARAFNMASRDGSSLQGTTSATKRLFGALQTWLHTPAPPDEAPQLGLPPTDLSGSFRIDQPATGSCLAVLSLGLIALLLIWYTTNALVALHLYYTAALWAGMITSAATVLAAQVLTYLQHYEASAPPISQRKQ